MNHGGLDSATRWPFISQDCKIVMQSLLFYADTTILTNGSNDERPERPFDLLIQDMIRNSVGTNYTNNKGKKARSGNGGKRGDISGKTEAPGVFGGRTGRHDERSSGVTSAARGRNSGPT